MPILYVIIFIPQKSVKNLENRYHSLRKKLIDKGYVKNNVFVKDYVFNDKREAAIVLLGRNIPEEAERVLWFATGSYKV